MKKKFVLKNKTRFITALLIPAAIISVLFFSQPVMGFNAGTYEVVKVSQGDTLWGIALKYNKRDDIRKFIYNIKTLNSLEDSFIVAGDTLKIPK